MAENPESSINRRTFFGVGSAGLAPFIAGEGYAALPDERFTSIDRHTELVGEQQVRQDLEEGLFPITLGQYMVTGFPNSSSKKAVPYLDLPWVTQPSWPRTPAMMTCRFKCSFAPKPEHHWHRWWLYVSPVDSKGYRLEIVYVSSDNTLDHGSLAMPLISRITSRLGQIEDDLPHPLFEPKSLVRILNREITDAMAASPS